MLALTKRKRRSRFTIQCFPATLGDAARLKVNTSIEAVGVNSATRSNKVSHRQENHPARQTAADIYPTRAGEDEQETENLSGGAAEVSRRGGDDTLYKLFLIFSHYSRVNV